jgi:hypothetical protein
MNEYQANQLSFHLMAGASVRAQLEQGGGLRLVRSKDLSGCSAYVQVRSDDATRYDAEDGRRTAPRTGRDARSLS